METVYAFNISSAGRKQQCPKRSAGSVVCREKSTSLSSLLLNPVAPPEIILGPPGGSQVNVDFINFCRPAPPPWLRVAAGCTAHSLWLMKMGPKVRPRRDLTSPEIWILPAVSKHCQGSPTAQRRSQHSLKGKDENISFNAQHRDTVTDSEL